MWNFDGVACAAALELGNPVFLFHSNHLLYGFLGFLFWRPLSAALPRALPALQLFTSLLTAGGLAGLYRVVRPRLNHRYQALALTLCVAVSAVVWVWSIEAQVYALGFLALAWATYELLSPEHPHKWFRMGLLHAAAILGHIVHAIWIIPVLFWMHHENPKAKMRHLRQYLWPLILATVIPYAAVITFILQPKQWNDRWMIKWLMGSASLNPDSLLQWHVAGWSSPIQWALATPRIFWGTFWPYHTAVPFWCGALTVLSMTIVLSLLGRSWIVHRQKLWIFSVLWLAVYGLFFWTWEPTTECYRMTDLIPLAILFAMALETITHPAVRWALLSVLFLTLIPINLVTRIAPMNDPLHNALYQETQALEIATPPDSLYLTAGGSTWIYMLYFCGRSAWNLHSFSRDPDHLAKEIARHLHSQPVYIQQEALEVDGTAAWLSHYKLRPVAPGLSWMQIQ